FGSFMFTKYSQTFQRLPCCVKIPPYTFEHKGKHVHEIKKPHVCDSTCPDDEGKHASEEEGKQNFHYCDEKCPNCAYYCTLPYDHGKKHNTEHSTVHGNMLLTTFTCEDDEFEFEGHQLNVGDRGDFVLCHKLCEHIGRHRHIDYCKDPAVCEGPGGGKKEGLLEHIN
ncbi:10631_t:CDS:2, partial [Cetraspora pellucida]